MNDILPVNTLAGRGLGDNRAPLAEVLAEELVADRSRALELLASASAARIETADDAAKVADLLIMIRSLERALGRSREDRRQPHAEQVRIVDAAYGALIAPLSRARARDGSLQTMLDAWQREHGAEPIHASVASVGTRRGIEFCITDLPAVLAWLLEHHPGGMAQAARTIIGNYLRNLGVDMAGEANIPGVEITIAKKAHVR